MKVKGNQEDPGERYVRITYKNAEIKKEVITRAEALLPNPDDIDFSHNEVTRKTKIKPQSGKWIEYDGSIPGVGPIAWELLEKVLYAAGEYLSVNDIYRRTDNESFADASSVAVFIRHIRKAFGESGKEPWFILTAREPEYGICWAADKSWMLVKKEVESEDTQGIQEH